MGHHVQRTGVGHLVENNNIVHAPRREQPGIDELLEENEQLRSLVVELSRIVARNALERK